MIRRLLVTAVSVVSTAASLTAAESESRQLAQIDALFSNYSPVMPGCTVGVQKNGRTVLTRGYGVADLEAKRPLIPTSSVYMASVSKQFTAMAVLLLVDDGKIRLDDRARLIVPELPVYADEVTVRQLLAHNGGLRDYFTIGSLNGNEDEYPYSAKDVLDLLGRQQGLDFKPDTNHLYSNSGYVVLSLIVERVSGQKLNDFAKARIFDPLGMTQSRFQHIHTEVVPRKAHGYVKRDDGWAIADSVLDVVGDGGLYSTAPDMLRWIANMDSGKIGAKAVLSMRTPIRLKNGKLTGYGMGVALGSYRGLQLVHHGGGLAGYRTMTWWFPTEKLGIVISCNNGAARPAELASGVADVFLAGKLKAPTRLFPVETDENRRVLSGVYREAGGNYLEVASQDKGLVLVRPERPLAQVSLGVLALQSDPDGV